MAVKLVFGLITGLAIVASILMMMSQKHGKYLHRMLEVFDDDALFNEAYETMMREDTDALFLQKGKLLKLWHDIDKEYYDRVDDDLADIDLDIVIGPDKEHASIGDSEDALSYLYLFAPATLYARGHADIAEKLAEKRRPYGDRIDDTVLQRLSEANEKFLKKEDDCGLGFYDNYLHGRAGTLSFSSGLVNMYKDFAAVAYCKYYYDKNWPLHFAEYAMYLPSINRTAIGSRWIREAGLDLPEEFFNYKPGMLEDYQIPGYIKLMFAEEPDPDAAANLFEDEIIEDEIIEDGVSGEPDKEETE